jgi:hypothetical protein
MTKYYSKFDETTSYFRLVNIKCLLSMAYERDEPGSLIAVTGRFADSQQTNTLEGQS